MTSRDKELASDRALRWFPAIMRYVGLVIVANEAFIRDAPTERPVLMGIVLTMMTGSLAFDAWRDRK